MSTRTERSAKRQQQKYVRNLAWLGGIAAVIAAAFLLLGKKTPTQMVVPAQVGQPLSQFSLADIQGKTVHLQDYAGQVVLVNAWATWCPPCKAEMPALNAYYRAHQSEGFVLLAVNAGDSASQAAAFATQSGLAFPVLLDADLRLLNGLGIRSYPTSIIVGRDGLVQDIHVGMFSAESLEAEITPLLDSE